MNETRRGPEAGDRMTESESLRHHAGYRGDDALTPVAGEDDRGVVGLPRLLTASAILTWSPPMGTTAVRCANRAWMR